MRIGVTVALLIALCVLFTLLGSAAPVDAAPSSVVNNSDTIIEIQIQPNGDANISVVTLIPLEDTNDTAGFTEVAGEFKAGSITGNTLNSFRYAARAANNTSNRSMSIDNDSIERTAARDGSVGKLIINFTWENFAKKSTSGTKRYLTVNDAFSTPKGTWLPMLREGQALKIRGPEGYHVDSASTGHTKGSFVFKDKQWLEPINITYASGSSSPGVDGSVFGSPRVVIGAAALITFVVLGSVSLFAFSRRDEFRQRLPADMEFLSNGPEHGEDDEEQATSDEFEALPDSTPDTFPDIDVELLSDEERVERLLAANGGRMKQTNIVKETDWSHAKVSQLLSAMDEDGRIEKLRIGRENLISVPDHRKDDQNRS